MELKGAAIVCVPAVLNRTSVRELRVALGQAIADPHSSAAVLIGADDHMFCRGLDLTALRADAEMTDALEDFRVCLETIRLGQKPVLGFVQGAIVGGGVGLAAACDGVLATPDATFTLTELLFGLTPALILPYLAERLTVQKLRWIALTSQPLGAEEALRHGLVDRVEPAEKGPRVLQAWIKRLGRIDREIVGVWKQTSVGPPSPGSREGQGQTLSRLRNPVVLGRIRSFVETGEPPWIQRE